MRILSLSLLLLVLDVIVATYGVALNLDKLGIAHSTFVAVCAVAVIIFVIFKLMKRHYEIS